MARILALPNPLVTVPVSVGGTGLTSYAVGDLIYASGATTLAKLAAVATGRVLVSAGVTTAPAWSASPTLTTATLTAGTGTGTYQPSGRILVNTTSQATTGTSEETLASVTVPGNTLAANGSALRLTALFTTAANTNTKIARLRWNGTAGTVIAAGSTASSGSALFVVGHVIRTGASAQIVGGGGFGSAPNAATAATTDTVDLTGDIVVYVRGLTATASGDLTFIALLVEYLP